MGSNTSSIINITGNTIEKNTLLDSNVSSEIDVAKPIKMLVLSRKSIKCCDISSFYPNIVTEKYNTAKILIASAAKYKKRKLLPFHKKGLTSVH